MTGPILSLDTLVVRPKISIDGDLHEILSPDELPVLTSHMLAMLGQRMNVLMTAAELDQEQQGELVTIVCQLSDTIMVAVPPEVRDKLSDAQRMSVIESFTALLLSKKAGTAAALMKGLFPAIENLTGASSSPACNGSTAARRGGGSAKRRSRS